ncbi:MAG: signal recognition particle protein, partial [Nocardioidaceae bacterium]|nr:signal recognition particle protein [Nocardioidaceae bacterium]
LSMASGGGMGAMPGLGGLPGGGKRAKGRQQAQQSRKKRGSGNPAKRAAEARTGAAPQQPANDGAAAFGFGNDSSTQLPEGFELPKNLKDLL